MNSNGTKIKKWEMTLALKATQLQAYELWMLVCLP
jgi:hypothetical protein